jgi:fructoselysine-6-P-deglycase FrlB-like protein
VIYLGSGPLEALAKEAALKIMELTGGAVMTMANSALGFRHGPKAAVNRKRWCCCSAAPIRWRAATKAICWKNCAATRWQQPA